MSRSRAAISAALLLIINSVAAAQPTRPAPPPPPAPPAPPLPPEPPAPPEPPEPPAAVGPPPDSGIAVMAPATHTDDEPEAEVLSRRRGWNSKWAVLFSLNNVLQVQQVLSQFQGLGIAGRYHLSSTRAIRFGATLSHSFTPQEETKTTTRIGDTVVEDYTVTEGNSSYTVAAAADYLMRYGNRTVAPYAGLGAFAGWTRDGQFLNDDLSIMDQVHMFSSRDTNFVIGARGVFGVDWRLHPNFAVFAEYSLSVPIVQWHSFSQTDTRTDTIAGVSAQTKIQEKETTWLEWGLGLAQGASLGLSVLF
ncbi:MAG: outer membrane beta-barrel protein [Kofleriaceae bacterium]